MDTAAHVSDVCGRALQQCCNNDALQHIRMMCVAGRCSKEAHLYCYIYTTTSTAVSAAVFGCSVQLQCFFNLQYDWKCIVLPICKSI